MTSLAVIHPPVRAYVDPWTQTVFGEDGVEGRHDLHVAAEKGEVIMPKLGNATAKAELGRATWKLLHTMTLRFPDASVKGYLSPYGRRLTKQSQKPTDDQRHALESYFYLFSRLYPCGECAREFQQLLKKYPPQTSSRKTASLWLCYVHNLVNARLGKPEFDCLKLDETYDCGCGPEGNSTSTVGPKRDEITGVEVVRGG
ncbi:hypothetical protein FRC01_003611 [Tulasnella sp. 417]|nr:hypothetical protein FRC01_003611 [Tulasnella sp. 417]